MVLCKHGMVSNDTFKTSDYRTSLDIDMHDLWHIYWHGAINTEPDSLRTGLHCTSYKQRAVTRPLHTGEGQKACTFGQPSDLDRPCLPAAEHDGSLDQRLCYEFLRAAQRLAVPGYLRFTRQGDQRCDMNCFIMVKKVARMNLGRTAARARPCSCC